MPRDGLILRLGCRSPSGVCTHPQWAPSTINKYGWLGLHAAVGTRGYRHMHCIALMHLFLICIICHNNYVLLFHWLVASYCSEPEGLILFWDTEPEGQISTYYFDTEPEGQISNYYFDTEPEGQISTYYFDTEPEGQISSYYFDTEPEWQISTCCFDIEPEGQISTRHFTAKLPVLLV